MSRDEGVSVDSTAVVRERVREWHDDFGPVRVVEAGDGPAVLYLHGVGDQGGLLPALRVTAAARHVIRPDHPGFLWSADAGVASVSELAQWYARVLPEWASDDIDLVGCSLGGWIAAELALASPQRFRSLTLIDPAGLSGPEAFADVFTLPPGEILTRTYATAAFRSAPPPAPEIAAALARSRATAARIASAPYMHDPSLEARLAALELPVDVIWGREDGILPAATAESWARAIPHAHVHVIPDAGHLPHMEQPERFRETARFL